MQNMNSQKNKRKYRTLDIHISSVLIEVCLKKYTSQLELAELIDVSQSVVSRWLHKERGMSYMQFSKILNLLNDEDFQILITKWKNI